MALTFLTHEINPTITKSQDDSIPDHIQVAQKMAIEINANESPLQRLEMIESIKRDLIDQLFAEKEYEKNRLNEATTMLQRIENCLNAL